MSLTSLLKYDKYVERLFDVLPSFEPMIKKHRCSYDENEKIFVKRPSGADAAIVGTAYDFWLRAYIQRINTIQANSKLPHQVEYGLQIMLDKGFLNFNLLMKFGELVDESWHNRLLYIKGHDVSHQKLAEACLYLAYCEAAFRSSKGRPEGYFDTNSQDVLDLVNLMEITEKSPGLFKSKSKIVLNPTFGIYSDMVGGADADIVVGDILVDIKTTTYKKYNHEHFHQLLGYYLLSEYDDTFPSEINHIGVYLPRFGESWFVSIEDIEKKINLPLFARYFRDIISGNRNSGFLKINTEQLHEYLLL